MKKPSLFCTQTKCFRPAARFSTVCQRHRSSDNNGGHDYAPHSHAGPPVVPTPISPQQSSI